jgi:hypothetical protein
MEAVCKIRIGTLKQKVLFRNNESSFVKEEQVPLYLLPKFLATEKDLDTVSLSGAPKDFMKKIEDETKKIERTLHSDKEKFIIFKYI